MKVITGFTEEGHIGISEGDMVTVIDGRYVLCVCMYLYQHIQSDIRIIKQPCLIIRISVNVLNNTKSFTK